jgi:hypothetical protein
MEGEQAIKKKRIRKKTCEIDSLEKLKSDTKTKIKEPIAKESKPKITKVSKKDDKEELNQSQISFGKFNITVKKKESMTAEELRNYYDNKFKIEESEKTAKLMVQEDDSNMIFEPIMEDEEIYLEKNNVLKIASKPPEKSKTKIERTNVHRVLSKFISDIKTEWPEKTDVYCWWCCHSFDTMPIPCPLEYDEIRNRYKVNGVFCSWSCAAAHSIKEYSSLALIYQLKNELCGYSENIAVAPPKYCLKNFGGYMTIKDFRSIDKSKTLLISTEGLSYINQEILEIRFS